MSSPSSHQHPHHGEYSPQEYNIFRDSLLRYCGYANEVGESFRYQYPRFVVPSYIIAATYCLGDASSDVYKIMSEDENNDENEENGDNTILAASNESEAIIVRAAQKAALFDSRAITLMDFAENGPSLNVSSLTSGKEPPSPSAAASGGTYKFPYKSPFRTAKKENRVRIHRRSSSYFSEEYSDNRPISPTSPSPRYQAPASPRF